MNWKWAPVIVAALASAAYGQQPTVTRVVNAASLPGTGEMGVAPGSLASVFGTNLGGTAMAASTNPLPEMLGGVSVTVGGMAARLLYVSATQLNVQIPWALLESGQQSRTAPLVVTRGGMAGAPFNVNIARLSPAVFTTGNSGSGLAVVLNAADGSYAQAAGSVSGRAARPASRGSVVMIYANGLGEVTPSIATGLASSDLFRRTKGTVEVLIGGRPAEVLYAGLATTVAGASHLNVVVPMDVQPGNAVAVQLRLGGMTTMAATTMAVDAAAAPAVGRPGASGMEIWSYLLQQNFRQNFKLWPGTGQLYPGTQPHGALLSTYVNQIAYDAILAKAGTMPGGSLIVKENHMPDQSLAATTVMYKIPGFDAANGDWFYLTRTAEGMIANEGRVAGCMGCHRLAAGNDYLYLGAVVASPAPTSDAVKDFLAKQNYRQTWRRWPGTGEFYSGSQPHGMLLTTYVNQVAFDAIRQRKGTMPDGAMIVKENYMQDRTLAALTVMYKSAGFDPANNDWFWQQQLADGSVPASGRVAGCASCHRQVTGNDYLFTGSIAPFPEPRAAAVWEHMQKEEYQKNWKLMPGTEAQQRGSQPHGSLVTTYVNPTALEAIQQQRKLLPTGSVVVKENYMPDRTLAAVTVMYKVEGYNPDSNDWYWLQRLANGTVAAEGRVSGCQNCHRAVADKDYLYLR